MIRYIIRRLLWAVVLFIAVTLVTFVIFYLIPVDPARLAAGKAATPADVKRVAHRLYLDQPIWKQYLHFLDQLVLHGNLGYSYANRQSVNDMIRSAAPITASLVIGAAILWMLIAIPIGVLSALRPRSRSTASRWSSCWPASRCTRCGWRWSAPTSWATSRPPGTSSSSTSRRSRCSRSRATARSPAPRPGSTCGGPVDWFYHLLLPWSVFAFLYAAFYVRLVRSQVMEVQNEDYVRTARAKGAPERRVLTQHVLRNAMLPVVTAFGMDVALALGGAVLLESVYGLPGLGLRGDQVAQPVRLPDHAGGGGVRLCGGDHLQPDRRPAVRLDRSAHPARLTITYHPPIWPFSTSRI